jgi:tRNA(Arg) A34 adenosine deaminase TadA
MCLGAVYRAKIDALYFANTQADAEAIHFSDHFIYEEFNREVKDRSLPTYQIDNTEAIKVFQERAEKEDKIEY